MDKKIVQQVILETLDAVNDQVRMITGYNGKIPWIEIDITKDYLRTLYENVLVLERYNVSESDFENTYETENQEEIPENQNSDEAIFQPLEKKIVEEEVVIEKPVEEKEEKVPEEEQKEEVRTKEPEKDLEKEPGKEPLPEKPEPLPEIKETIVEKDPVKEEPEPQKTEKPEPKKEETEETTHKPTEKGSTVGEKLGGEKKSLGEVIQKDEGSLNENMGKKPIRKLKSAIGINDKFFFVNELFHGVLKDYNDAITSLDSAVGREAAVEILGNLQKKHEWDTNGEGYKKLEDFVNRKF
jgi:hypothetical protein